MSINKYPSTVPVSRKKIGPFKDSSCSLTWKRRDSNCWVGLREGIGCEHLQSRGFGEEWRTEIRGHPFFPKLSGFLASNRLRHLQSFFFPSTMKPNRGLRFVAGDHENHHNNNSKQTTATNSNNSNSRRRRRRRRSLYKVIRSMIMNTNRILIDICWQYQIKKV